jgi:enoyl-CoA hydratase/carnithine racemase
LALQAQTIDYIQHVKPILAAKGTEFGLPDTKLGLSPTSGMTWLLPASEKTIYSQAA